MEPAEELNKEEEFFLLLKERTLLFEIVGFNEDATRVLRHEVASSRFQKRKGDTAKRLF